MKRPRADWLAGAILIYFLLLGSVYAALTPPFESPDEGSHFLYIHNLLEDRTLPVLEDRATVFASGSAQRHHPPLYYALGALLIAGTDRDDIDRFTQVNPLASIGTVTLNNVNVYLHDPAAASDGTARAVAVLRGFSIALGAATLWCVYRVGTLATGTARTGLLAMLLVASMPGYVFISASINNDNLVTLCFAAGVWWSLHVWTAQRLTRRNMLALAVILAAAALSKLNGLGLFALIYGGLLVAAQQGRIRWAQAGQAIGVSLLVVLALAGWWYVRNWRLYGDPLALDATRAIWGRGAAPTLAELRSELSGTWQSVWMVLGHFNIRGPDWLFSYVTFASWVGGVGALIAAIRRPVLRARFAFLALTVLLVFAALIVATRQINVSQGRILYPALVAFAPLLVAGWLAWGDHVFASRWVARWLPVMGIAPLAVVALAAPLAVIRPAYPALEVVGAVPPDVRRVDAAADTLSLLAFENRTRAVEPGDVARVDVYIQGRHPANPLLFVKAFDPVSEQPVGGVDLFPGMALPAWLDPAQVYRVPIRVAIDHTIDGPPRRLEWVVGWRIPDPDDVGEGPVLKWTDPAGNPLETLFLPGPVVVPDYAAPDPEHALDVVFAETIRLQGYSVAAPPGLQPGTAIEIMLVWDVLAPTPDAWAAAVALLNADGVRVAGADGPMAAYPSEAWRRGPAFPDARTIVLPPDAAPGLYYLSVGWYRQGDGVRLPARGDDVRDELYISPDPVLKISAP